MLSKHTNMRMSKIMITTKLPGILAVLVLAGTLAACNTAEGLGEDIEAAGEAIEEEAED